MALLGWIKGKLGLAAEAPAPEQRRADPAAAPAEPLATEDLAGAIAPRPAPAPANERREKTRINPAEGTRALIIDDSPTIVALLRKFLRQNNYETLEAGDAETGLELARSQAPHIIFLDIVMPNMDGFAALRALRKDPVTRDIPVIMISGNEQATEQFYVQRIGADDFMKKPFSRAEVFVRINRLIGEDRTLRRRREQATT